MRITKEILKHIIKEEIDDVNNEYISGVTNMISTGDISDLEQGIELAVTAGVPIIFKSGVPRSVLTYIADLENAEALSLMVHPEQNQRVLVRVVANGFTPLDDVKKVATDDFKSRAPRAHHRANQVLALSGL